MLFNSYEFIFGFLPIVLFGFFWVARSSYRLAAMWLAVASLFFYSWWNPWFVLFLLGSIGINYVMGYAIGYAIGYARRSHSATTYPKIVLAAAISFNLVLLGYFKYTNFLIGTANQFAAVNWEVENIALPLGISFFTFTQIAFLVDVYRGMSARYSFSHYLLFVTYFPHLIAGPVLNHKQIIPQLGQASTYRFNINNVGIGLTIFTIGLFKKVVLADQLAPYSSQIFEGVKGMDPTLIEAWIGALSYTLQLYFDFSGYSDMAIGLSRMFNIDLPLNFASPYRATSIIEFWQRWHMTLSAFLRNYLYIPLGGNRHGSVRRYINLMITMLLGGLWHGASWTFVIWGGLHGCYLVVNHGWRVLWQKLGMPRMPGGSLLAGAVTFIAVVVAWVPFRADSYDTAMRMLKGMFGMNGLSFPHGLERQFPLLVSSGVHFNGFMPITGLASLELALWLCAGLLIVWFLPNTQSWMRCETASADGVVAGRKWVEWRPSPGVAVLIGGMLGIAILGVTRKSEFLYFQF
jgi:alginate O-acetyltransferase complex protein AlgI